MILEVKAKESGEVVWHGDAAALYLDPDKQQFSRAEVAAMVGLEVTLANVSHCADVFFGKEVFRVARS